MDEQMIGAIASLVYYVLQVIGDWMLFKKAGKKGWHSVIPILNVYDEYDICWKGSRGILFLILTGILYSFISFISSTQKGTTNP